MILMISVCILSVFIAACVREHLTASISFSRGPINTVNLSLACSLSIHKIHVRDDFFFGINFDTALLF
jgi:hypothetical protein